MPTICGGQIKNLQFLPWTGYKTSFQTMTNQGKSQYAK